MPQIWDNKHQMGALRPVLVSTILKKKRRIETKKPFFELLCFGLNIAQLTWGIAKNLNITPGQYSIKFCDGSLY